MNILRKGAYYACLSRAVAQNLNSDIDVVLFYLISNKMKAQLTENKENLFCEKKIQGVGSDLKMLNIFCCCSLSNMLNMLQTLRHSLYC